MVAETTGATVAKADTRTAGMTRADASEELTQVVTEAIRTALVDRWLDRLSLGDLLEVATDVIHRGEPGERERTEEDDRADAN